MARGLACSKWSTQTWKPVAKTTGRLNTSTQVTLLADVQIEKHRGRKTARIKKTAR